MAYDDGIKVGPIAYIGLVSVILTFVLVLALQVLYYQQRNRMSDGAMAASGRPHELVELTSEQQLALTQQGYVDREQGVVAIGVERAKELVVRELAQGMTPADVNGPRRAAPPATEQADADGQAGASAAEQEAGAAEADTPSSAEGGEKP